MPDVTGGWGRGNDPRPVDLPLKEPDNVYGPDLPEMVEEKILEDIRFDRSQIKDNGYELEGSSIVSRTYGVVGRLCPGTYTKPGTLHINHDLNNYESLDGTLSFRRLAEERGVIVFRESPSLEEVAVELGSRKRMIEGLLNLINDIG